jgi:hypothetical protein
MTSVLALIGIGLVACDQQSSSGGSAADPTNVLKDKDFQAKYFDFLPTVRKLIKQQAITTRYREPRTIC